MTRDFDPESYEDRYRTRLQQLVDAKAKTKGKGHAAETEPDDDAEDAPASQAAPDLMAALRQSLAAAKNG